MDGRAQADKADRLRALHHLERPLLLPNAWDVASARAVVDAGFAAVATTSGGVAASLGWPDGERIPWEEMLAAVTRIAQAVEVPVTADIESGYGLSPEDLAEALVEAGAVGCNIEDTDHHGSGVLLPSETQAERIGAIKEASLRAGVSIVVNARIDVFVRRTGGGEERVELAVERGDRYARAGADCVYPIGAGEGEIAAFVGRVPGPVNAMARPGVARLSHLVSLPVARISFGSALQRLLTSDLADRLAAISAGADDWSE